MPIVAEFVLALAIAMSVQNLTEWLSHKYLLHMIGANRKSWFHYHWEHHQRCRKAGNVDQEYVDWFHGDWSKMLTKEVGFMVGLSVFVAGPSFYIWPALGLATFLGLWVYFFAHAYSHVNVAWGKKWMRWHYDHHMGQDQNKNWSVTFPWFDWLANTRVKMSDKDRGGL